MHRRHTLVTRLLLTLSLLSLPAFALSPSPGAAPMAERLGAPDLLASFRAWLGGIWPQIGCTIDPDGVVHCNPNGITPPGRQGHGRTAAGGTAAH